MPFLETLKFISLLSLRDLHLFTRMEQEKCQVTHTVAPDSSLEGSLPHVIIHHQTHIFLAPDRLLPPLPTP